MRKPSITAFFPCYNDAQTIGDLVVQADQALRELTDDHEIIVINDGSRDDSARVLQSLCGRVELLRIVTHETNRGYGAALRSGFANATKELVFYTDGDGQYDASEIGILLMLLTDDTHFVNGMKMTRQDPPYRVFFGNLHRFITRWMFWLPITDVDCDYRLIRRSILQTITLHSSSGSICVELVKQSQRAGAQFREVSIHHYARRSGASQFFTLGRILQTYTDLAFMWVELMVAPRFGG